MAEKQFKEGWRGQEAARCLHKNATRLYSYTLNMSSAAEHSQSPLTSTAEATFSSLDTSLLMEPTDPLEKLPASKRAGGRTTEISVALAVISAPLFLVSAALIGLVAIRRVKQQSSSSEIFAVEQDEPSVYYVNISSTTLVLLASFSSTLAPTLVGFVMSLFSYSISQRVLRLSETEQLWELPTPYQLVVLVSLLTGNISALWQWMKYTFRWRTVSVVNASAWGLILAYVLVYELQLWI
jgi:hypothetical protein